MPREKACDITLELDSEEELFEEPEVTPFSHDFHIHSYTLGIEFIADELSGHTSYESVHTTIILLQSEIVAGLEKDVKPAVKRYCCGRLKHIEHDLQATRWLGMTSPGITAKQAHVPAGNVRPPNISVR